MVAGSGSSMGTSSRPSTESSCRLLMSTSRGACVGCLAARGCTTLLGASGELSSVLSSDSHWGGGASCGSRNIASRSASVHCISSAESTRDGLDWETRRTLTPPKGSCYASAFSLPLLSPRSFVLSINGDNILFSASIFSSIIMNGR